MNSDGGTFGKERFEFDTVDSTSTAAFEKAAEGAPEGAVVVALSQTKGRGRTGAGWVSVKNAGLYASIILRPDPEAGFMEFIPLAAGLAAVRAVRNLTGLDALLKWPNDVFVDGKKVAGLLSEAQFDDAGKPVVVVGIGVNLNYPPEILAEKVKWYAAASLSDFGVTVGRWDMLDAFLGEFEIEYSRLRKRQTDALVSEINGLSALNGREVEIRGVNETIRGIAVEVDKTGGLAVDAGGEIRIVTAADVRLVEKPPMDGE